jgi:hypothetical protein
MIIQETIQGRSFREGHSGKVIQGRSFREQWRNIVQGMTKR